jgi:CheY-like chemotaxis protein
LKSIKGAKILMVDDKASNLLALEAVFERLGHGMVMAHSGREALRCLLQDDFAVILLDVQMPEMDGFELAALIREQLKTRYSPIIFLTAVSVDASMHRGYALGAVDYLLKPFAPEVLRSKVKVLVEMHQNTADIKQVNEELRAVNSRLELRERQSRTVLEECGRKLSKSNAELVAMRNAERQDTGD